MNSTGSMLADGSGNHERQLLNPIRRIDDFRQALQPLQGKEWLGGLGESTLDPTSGRPFVMSNAEAKALGLLAGNAATVNGWVDSEVLRHSPLIRTTERSQISTTLSVWRNTRSQKSWGVMVSR